MQTSFLFWASFYSFNYRCHYLSCSTVIAELAEVDTLPCAKIELSVSDGNVDTYTRNDTLCVSRHIVGTFKHMPIVGHVLGNEPVIDSLHITPYFRIPVLANAQRTACMLHKEVEQSRLRQLWKMSEYLISYQMEATGLRL